MWLAKPRIVFLVCGVLLMSCTVTKHVDPDLQRIKSAAHEDSQVMNTLSYLSDVYGPRLLSTPEYFEAARWAKGALESWGLDDVSFESFGTEFRGWSVSSSSVEMIKPRYMPFIAQAKAFVRGTNGLLEGTPIFVDDFVSLEAMAGQLQGKIVFVATAQPTSTRFTSFSERFRSEDLERSEGFATPIPSADIAINPPDLADKPFREYMNDIDEILSVRRIIDEFLIEEGVGAIIEPSRFSHGILLVGGTAYDREGDIRPVPSFVVANEHFYRAKRMAEKGIRPIIRLNLETDFVHEPSYNVSVLGEITGVDPNVSNQVVMIGAHLDSWHAGTGATDNAAGAAVMMEAMRILASLDIKPKRTIRIALWGGEETGLNGSLDYVRRHITESLDPQDIYAYINQDLGTGRIRGVYAQGNSAIQPILKNMLAPFAKEDANYVTIQNTNYTDHESFDEAEVPSFTLLQDMVNTYSVTWHTNMDLYEYAIEEDLTHNAALVAVLAYQLSMRDGALPNK